MNEMVKVNYDNDTPTVSGRELHGFLGIGTDYAKWFERMCEYGFQEGIDHSSFLTDGDGFGKAATRIDHQLTIDMAKELCMIQRTDRGKQARQYFIRLEKAWNTPELVMARALKLSNKKITELNNVIELQRPQVEFANRVASTDDLIDIGTYAKIVWGYDTELGRNKMYKFLRDIGILISNEEPYQRYINNGWFKVIEDIVLTRNGDKLVRKAMITGKGQIKLNKLLKKRHVA